MAALDELKRYCNARPSVVLIDSFESFDYSVTRGGFYSRTGKFFENVTLNGTRLRLPWQFNLGKAQTNSLELIQSEMNKAKVVFPVMIKTNQSTVTAESHFITVVFNLEGLREALDSYTDELIIQEFVNHDKVVYKVYAIGNHYTYYPRPSCSNIESSQDNMVGFRSDKPWPQKLLSQEEPITRQLDSRVLDYCVSTLKEHAKISLFGVDILVQSGTLDYVICDLNAFPGYKEYQEVGSYIDELVKSLLDN